MLFETLRRLASEGCSILYISPQAGGDPRAVRPRHHPARRQGGRPTAIPRAGDRARHGRDDDRRQPQRRPQREAGTIGAGAPAVDGLTLASAEQFGVALEDVSLEVAGGEILGIAGVAGNGQNELMLALIGERSRATPEAIQHRRRAGRRGSARRARRALGLCFVPEERNGHAAVPDMSLAENAVLTGRVRMGLAQLRLHRRAAAPRASPAR